MSADAAMQTRSSREPAHRLAVLVIALVAIAAVATGASNHPRASAASPSAGGTLHVVMPGPAWQGFDPQAAYTSDQFEVLRCCMQRTLMTFPGLAGVEGFRSVPDLATGPPGVSADGRTWTFHIRSGIHYSPPLQDVEVTAADFVRALERTKDAFGPGETYLKTLLEGYAAFADGRSDSISGAVAIDPHTLQLRETGPDRSIVDLMAMAFSAPIPPSPTDPSAPLGLAAGHPFQTNDTHPERPPLNVGYGPFQVTTGPYMIEGSDTIDFTQPPDEQQPAPGFLPSWGNGYYNGPAVQGRLVLVRNPSWDTTNDPTRLAYPDRIEIEIQPRGNPYPELLAGTVDTVLGEDPPVEELAKYGSSAERSRVHHTDGNGINWVTLNLAQPPFDDIHVRRAFSNALNRQAMQHAMIRETGDVSYGPVTSHIVPNPMLNNLLAGWQPLAGASEAARIEQAQVEMRQSRYWHAGHCVGAACRPLRVGGFEHPAAMKVVADAVKAIGLTPKIVYQDEDPTHNCFDPVNRFVACAFGWVADYPSTGAMFQPFLNGLGGGDFGLSGTGLGATPGQLRRAGMSVTRVPSIQLDYDQCVAALPAQAPTCWARLDQWLTSKLVAVVPTMGRESVRLAGANVSAFSVDQAYNEPSLDRLDPGG